MDNKTLEKKEVLRKKREKRKQERNACFFQVTKKKVNKNIALITLRE